MLFVVFYNLTYRIIHLTSYLRSINTGISTHDIKLLAFKVGVLIYSMTATDVISSSGALPASRAVKRGLILHHIWQPKQP